MNEEESVKHYLISTNELLLKFAREAKQQADKTRGTECGNFDAGYLMGFHRIITLMQQQALAFGLEVSKIGLDKIDANRDLT